MVYNEAEVTLLIQIFNDNEIVDLYKAKESLESIRQAFVNDYSLDRIKNLKMHEYASGIKTSTLPYDGKTFCYRIETELSLLGSIKGSTAKKFGLYYGSKKLKYEYAKKYGNSADEAFENIMNEIHEIIIAGNNDDYNAINNSRLSHMFKCKILATYFPNKYLCISNKEHIIYFLNRLGINNVYEIDAIENHNLLVKFKNKQPIMKFWSNYQYMNFLYKNFIDDFNQTKIDKTRTKKGNKQYSEENKILNESLDFELIEDFKKIKIDSNRTYKYYNEIKKKADSIIIKGRKSYQRDRQTSMNALGIAGFKCETCSEHKTFKRKLDGTNYTEPHHLIPMAYQDDFKVSLDIEENIVSLCSNCHNEIHYGEEAPKLIELFFEKRRELIKNKKIEISLKELLKLYK